MFSDYLQSGPGSGATFSDYLQLCGALFAMGDELNEKTSQLIEVVSGSFFLAVVRLYFFGENSSNPFSRSYFFGELVSDDIGGINPPGDVG